MLKKPKFWFGGTALAVSIWFLYMGIGWLPKRVRYWILLTMAWFAFRIFRGKRELIEDNICLVRPSTAESRKDAWTNVKTLVNSWASLLSNQKDDLNEARNKIVGGELIKEVYDRGQKAVVVFPHVGDINGLASVVAALGIEVFVPAEALHPLVYKLVAGLRGRHGNIEFAPIRKGKTKDICGEKLRAGKVVVLAMDMTFPPGKGLPYAIGRGLAYFRVGAVKVALENDAEFFLAFPEVEDGKQTIYIKEFELIGQSEEANVARVLAAYEPFLVRNAPYWWRLSLMNMETAPPRMWAENRSGRPVDRVRVKN